MTPTAPRLRTVLLSAALAVTLAAPLIQSARAATPSTTALPAPAAAPAPQPATGPHGEVAHAPGQASPGAPGPEGAPGTAAMQPTTTAGQPVADPASAPTPLAADQGAACSPAAFASLGPAALADFLADPSHGYDDCLRPLLGGWRPELAKVFTTAHVRAVADRISTLAPRFDATNNLNQQGLWYYLHVAVLFDYGHDELDFNDDTTTTAIERAIAAYTANPRVFEPTTANGLAMGELLQTSTAPRLRPGRLPLTERVLKSFAPGGPAVGDRGWNWAVQSALQINFQGINNVVEDQGRYQAAVAAAPSFREALRAYAGYTHLKGTESEWAVRDAMSEYSRLHAVESIRPELKANAGAMITSLRNTFGRLSAPWNNIAVLVNDTGICGGHDACRADLEREVFPHTYSYDNGTLIVRTPLDRATADQLYYATKQVKAQFFRVIGTDRPLADDDHPVLTVRLYDTKANYKSLQYLLFGISDVENGGMFLEAPSTFYTYQRTSLESTFSLEELFRHEYTHYLNARWAIPETGYTDRWPSDATFTMNEGTAEYFAGSTSKDGVKARRTMVDQIAAEDRGGLTRLTVDQILHATWSGYQFRAYPYAATFFNMLGERHSDQLAEMYRLLRADDLAGYNAWRDRLGRDAGLQRDYTAYLDAAIGRLPGLYVPVTTYTSNGQLSYAWASEVRDAFTRSTQNAPVCKDNADWNNTMRFTCSGRITANLTNPADAGQTRKDMSGTIDYYLLARGGGAANNLADMNCWFGKVDVWPAGRAGTADYTCEGPLRR
ncbi:collagenase [Kitasatospora sp. NPDC058201]|uniref:collagenase n=1 Tax=Streptomycetaceae TaxID=2062 RepID=UPI002E79B2BC|nr:collagenase [Streptomyces sp. BE303]MED7953944.1 collagenase [Streptomyces sp. BE303]